MLGVSKTKLIIFPTPKPILVQFFSVTMNGNQLNRPETKEAFLTAFQVCSFLPFLLHPQSRHVINHPSQYYLSPDPVDLVNNFGFIQFYPPLPPLQNMWSLPSPGLVKEYFKSIFQKKLTSVMYMRTTINYYCTPFTSSAALCFYDKDNFLKLQRSSLV